MNRNDFRNPLIQSGILLLVVFLFISIVASSPAEGFFGSIFALVSGLMKGLLFVIALSIGLVISIAILIGIFLFAVSIHSVDKAKTMFEQLKTALAALYCTVRSCTDSPLDVKEEKAAVEEQAPPVSPVEPVVEAVTPQQSVGSETEERINVLVNKLDELTTSLSSVDERLLALQSQVDQQQSAAAEREENFKRFEETSAYLTNNLKIQTDTIDSASSAISALENSITSQLNSITKEIDELHKKTSVPEVVSGILSYVDTQEDRDTLTERAEEAVSRGMTYAQTDDFFKEVLPAKVHKALSEHPRLTKDYIRSVKKKFE